MIETCSNLFNGICKWNHDDNHGIDCVCAWCSVICVVLCCIVLYRVGLWWFELGCGGVGQCGTRFALLLICLFLFLPPQCIKGQSSSSMSNSMACHDQSSQTTTTNFYQFLPTNRLRLTFLMHFDAFCTWSLLGYPHPTPEHGVHQDHHRSDSCERKPARAMFKPKHVKTVKTLNPIPSSSHAMLGDCVFDHTSPKQVFAGPKRAPTGREWKQT
jgi:hypothetical protein